MRTGRAVSALRSRAWRSLGAALLGVAGVSGCAEPPPSARADHLELVVPTEVGSLDPRFTTRALDIKITRLIHSGLAGLNPDTLEPVPLLAESWRWLDPLRLEVTLRRGLKFHSGKPLQIEDVCATLEALADPSLGSPHRVVVASIGECKASGSRTLELRLEKPRATLLSDLEVPILRADQVKLPQNPRGDLDGLGPYRIESFDWAEVRLAPILDPPSPMRAAPESVPSRVTIRTIRDENARALRLIAGSADIAPNAISATILPALAAQPDLEVRSRVGANVTYLLFQNDREPTNRAPVRRAVGQAINRQLIVDTLLAGKAQLASGIFPHGHWSADPDAQALPFDLAAAKAVLSDAPPLTLATSTDRARLTIARAISQMLGDAGVSVRVVALDLGVLLKRLDAGDFQLAVLQMPELTEPNLLNWFFNPRGIPGEGGEGRNRARYRSQEVGEWLDAAARDPERSVRVEYYRRIARAMARDLPVLPLWHEDQVSVVSRRAGSFNLDAIGRWGSLSDAH